PQEVEKFRQILSRACALVHPTKSDTNPAIIIESGYFGCPAISSRIFAIPEVVDDGRTGLLLDYPIHVAHLVKAMTWMLENSDQYMAMRKSVWIKTRQGHSKKQFQDRFISYIQEITGRKKAISRQRINFVSNLPPNLRSGGFSAMNVGALGALQKLATVHYV